MVPFPLPPVETLTKNSSLIYTLRTEWGPEDKIHRSAGPTDDKIPGRFLTLKLVHTEVSSNLSIIAEVFPFLAPAASAVGSCLFRSFQFGGQQLSL